MATNRFLWEPKEEERHHLWSLLRPLKTTSDLPWLLVGDFNEILFQHEKDGSLARSTGAMSAFQDALSDCNLTDLGYNGTTFTWRNGRGDGLLRLQLDRAVANMDWLGIFQRHRVFHLSSSHSDHVPILVKDRTSYKDKNSTWGYIPRYDPYWLRDEEFGTNFKAAWAGSCQIYDD